MKEVFLGDICKITSSKRIFESEYVRNGVAFIRGQEISDKTIGREGVDYECYISKKRYEELKKSNGVPKIGDILITAVGTIGNLCYVDFDMPFYFKDGNVIWFTDFSDAVDSHYLYYFMQSPYFKKQLENALIGAVQKALTMVMLKYIHFKLPPMDVQKAIVKIMSNIDDKINLNDSICSDLESMAKLLYDYWFVQFDFPDENGRPYKSSGGKMVWNDELKREIPEGWLDGKLSDILRKDIRGIRPDEIGNLPYTPMDILPCNQMSFGNTGDKADANSSLIKYDKYSILFGAMRPYFHRVCIAPFDGVTRTTVFTLYSNYDDELGYSYETLNQDYCVNYANLHHVGTQQPYAEWDKNLEDCKIALPPKKLKKDYSDKTQSLIDSVIELQLENKELASLRDFLLPMLMNGQIKIEDVKAS